MVLMQVIISGVVPIAKFTHFHIFIYTFCTISDTENSVEFYDFLRVKSSTEESEEATKCSSSVDQEEEEDEQWRKHGGLPFIDFLRIRSSSCSLNNLETKYM